MEHTYQTLLERIRRGVGPDRELDADLWRLYEPTAVAANAEVPLLTSSLDAALGFANAMLNRRRGKYSYRIDINIDGSAVVSIGVQDRPGNMREFESPNTQSRTPPRAVLDALCQAVLA
jgi:hypothetical protein